MEPQSVLCEVCAKRVPKSGAVISEGRDHTAYFCGAGCYERWRGERAPAAQAAQEGAGRSKSRDERVKRALRRHPQRDQPKTDSVEPDELPPR